MSAKRVLRAEPARGTSSPAHPCTRAPCAQVRGEVMGSLDFMRHVYDTFGMPFELELSTRPDKAVGVEDADGLARWERAEAAMRDCLNEFAGAGEWTLNPGDGAFYGPKIDVKVTDAIGRSHQAATVQLDFQMPERFNLQYTASDGSFARPVMVHRAMLGSVERMIAILIEHYAGKWPFWLSPRQAIILPIDADLNDQILHRLTRS